MNVCSRWIYCVVEDFSLNRMERTVKTVYRFSSAELFSAAGGFSRTCVHLMKILLFYCVV